MTKKAGPDLDAEIAEKVMGWEPRPGGRWTNNATRQWSVSASHLPKYSEKIAAAFRVLERVGGLCGVGYAPGRKEWTAYFQTGIHLPTYRASADAAPLAICLAALEAVEAPAKARKK